MTNFNLFMHIRKLILIANKLLGILFCIYYIINVKNYNIYWSLLDWLIPSYVANINQQLSKLGTYILVIPLAIIILSLLIPENINLHILSSFFGVTSILLATIRSLYHNSLAEATNFKLFTVSHILSLQEKRDIFVTEYRRIAKESYLHVINTYTYIMEQVNTEGFIIHDKILHDLNLPSQKKQYAQAVITETVTYYAKSLEVSSSSLSSLPSLKTVLICFTVALTLMGAMVLANKLVTDWTDSIRLLIETSHDATEALTLIKDMQKLTTEAGLLTNDGVLDVSSVLAKLNISIDKAYRLLGYIRNNSLAIADRPEFDSIMP